MDNTTSMQAQPKLSFLHHIRLVPLFSSMASLEEQGARLTEAVGAFRLNGARAGRTTAAATAAKPAPLTPAAAVSGDNWETF